MAADKLIERGCKRIAFLGEVRSLEVRERFAGVTQAVQQAGLPAPLQLDTHLASDTMADEIAAHLDFLAGWADGIVAASDLIAMYAVRALADQGLQVPSQMAIVGFDDLPLAESTIPRLTTVRQDLARGSAAMVEALFARIKGTDSPSLEMMPELIERDTA